MLRWGYDGNELPLLVKKNDDMKVNMNTFDLLKNMSMFAMELSNRVYARCMLWNAI